MVGGDLALVNLVDQKIFEADNTSRKGFDNALRRALGNLGMPNEMRFRPFCMRTASKMAKSSADRCQRAPVVVQAAARLRCWWSC